MESVILINMKKYTTLRFNNIFYSIFLKSKFTEYLYILTKNTAPKLGVICV